MFLSLSLSLIYDFSYYSDRGSCVKCYLSCDTCSGPRRDQCVKCPPSWKLAAGECHPECPEGFFKTEFGCQKCHHYCKTCNGKNSDVFAAREASTLITIFLSHPQLPDLLLARPVPITLCWRAPCVQNVSACNSTILRHKRARIATNHVGRVVVQGNIRAWRVRSLFIWIAWTTNACLVVPPKQHQKTKAAVTATKTQVGTLFTLSLRCRSFVFFFSLLYFIFFFSFVC